MLSADPSPARRLSRRRILIGGGQAFLVFATLGAATACRSNAPPAPDPLEAQVDLARRDSGLATAAAKVAPPIVAPALVEVAAERDRHASVLIEEIARAAGRPTPNEAASTTNTTPTSSLPAPPPPSVTDVINALRGSADSAARLAPTLSGYRAGLLGSIAAACTAAYAVALPSQARPR